MEELQNTLGVTIPVNSISGVLDINIQVHLLSQGKFFPSLLLQSFLLHSKLFTGLWIDILSELSHQEMPHRHYQDWFRYCFYADVCPSLARLWWSLPI